MSDARTHYRDQLKQLETRTTTIQRSHQWVVMVRPLLFFPSLLILSIGYLRDDTPSYVLWFGWLLAAIFIGVLVWHETIRSELASLLQRTKNYQRLIARLDRKWDAIPFSVHAGVSQFENATTRDLDVLGPRSLFHWMSLASSSIGQMRLAAWMTEWADAATIESRQLGVQDLRDQRDLREMIFHQSSMLSNAHATPEEFTKWATGGSWLARNRISHHWSRIGPLLVIVGLVCILLSPMTQMAWLQSIGMVTMAIGLLGNIVVMLGKVGAIHDIFQCINTGEREVNGYLELYQTMGKLQGESEMVRRIRHVSAEGDHSALRGFGQLQRLVMMANLQRNALFYVPYLLLQIFFLWDFRVMELLERWQVRMGSYTSGWLDGLADCEALLSAGTVADECRHWTKPIYTADGDPLVVQGLGHPLLPEEKRVGNDLTIQSERPLLLVTGSNMAGKSTLLRSLGLNVTIGRTGAPVCAESFQSRVFELSTSIRVQDSLQDGVSFFMAELHRLRDVVDHAREEAKKGAEGRPILSLLDEILQGTNSRERQIAVVHVAKQLVESRVITAISTHDLELADLPDVQQIAQIVHFREYFETIQGEAKMRFDYRMRPGPTPTTNALRLLEIVGLRKPN